MLGFPVAHAQGPLRDSDLQVSIIVPCFDSEATLARCLQSLIDQKTTIAFEIIVVDNGSKDGSRAIATRFSTTSDGKVVVASEPRPGSYAARNSGVRVAKGRVLVFTDADCRAGEGWLEALIVAMDPASPGVYGGLILPEGDQASLISRDAARAGILSADQAMAHLRAPFVQTANLAVRREDFERVSGFDETVFSGGDADFCWRFLKVTGGRIVLVRESVVFHHHRETIGSLYRQFRRYGEADVVMAARHGGLGFRGVAKTGLDSLRLLLTPLLSVLAVPRAIASRDLLSIVAPWLRSVRILARWRGRIGARLFPRRLHRT